MKDESLSCCRCISSHPTDCSGFLVAASKVASMPKTLLHTPITNFLPFKQMNNNECIAVWCVKYALTAGIYQLRGRITPDGYFAEDSSGRIGHFLSKTEYYLTLEDARIAAEELRQRRIKSLQKQLARIMTQEIKINESIND
jgi:hypothetical protein